MAMRVSLWEALGLPFRDPSGDRSAPETVTWDQDLSAVRSALFYLFLSNIETPNALDVIDFFFQTTYDNGDHWEDLAHHQLTIADNGTAPQIVVLTVPAAALNAALVFEAHSDQQLGAGIQRNLPLGSAARLVVLVAGPTSVYDYSVHVSLYG